MAKKLLLMTPPYPERERLGKLALLGGRLPSLSLLYLASYVRDLCQVTVLDAACENLTEEEALAGVARCAPDLVGISAVTPSIARAQRTAALIKERFPGLPVILGGPHLTSLPQETMERTPAIDLGVIGEGEVTLREIVSRFDGTLASIAAIPGTMARDGATGLPVTNEPRGLVHDIDSLGFPAYDLVPRRGGVRPALFKIRRLPAIHAITSRGCSHHCAYCNTNVFNRRVRFHSAEYVIELIERLVRAGYREIAFEDDNFTAHSARLERVCRHLVDRRVKLSWSVNARIDSVDRELLGLMKRAGCWYLSYGIESGSAETLERIRKGLTPERIREVVQFTRQAGMEAKGFFIVGFPWETEESLRQTASFALSLPLSDLNVFPLTPFHGTELYPVAKSSGSFCDDWSRMDLQQIVYVPERLTEELMQQTMRKMLLSFYLRPGTVANYLKRSLSAGAVLRALVQEV